MALIQGSQVNTLRKLLVTMHTSHQICFHTTCILQSSYRSTEPQLLSSSSDAWSCLNKANLSRLWLIFYYFFFIWINNILLRNEIGIFFFLIGEGKTIFQCERNQWKKHSMSRQILILLPRFMAWSPRKIIKYFFYEFVISSQIAKNKINIFCLFFTFAVTPSLLASRWSHFADIYKHFMLILHGSHQSSIQFQWHFVK